MYISSFAKKELSQKQTNMLKYRPHQKNENTAHSHHTMDSEENLYSTSAVRSKAPTQAAVPPAAA
jgi:hypothetical protein